MSKLPFSRLDLGVTFDDRRRPPVKLTDPILRSFLLNASYLPDSYIVFTLKIEYVSKIAIFGLKMMEKSSLDFFFCLKFLYVEAIFFEFILLPTLEENHKFSNNNTHLPV